MLKKYFGLLLFLLSLYGIYGCATFGYLLVEKNLTSRQIPKNQIENIKKVILQEGYVRITEDNYSYKGAIVTQYRKEVLAGKITGRVGVRLSFYDTEIASDFYRFLDIRIYKYGSTDIPEANDEVNRMEQVIYHKLIEIVGKDNVLREDR